MKKPFMYKSDLENVEKIIVDSDLSNILLTSTNTNTNLEYSVDKLFLGTPKIDILYNKDQAIIKVRTIPKQWMYILPTIRKRAELILNIPPKLLSRLEVHTNHGDIEVKNLIEVNHLNLRSHVGNIYIDSFKGASLKTEQKNGSTNIGVVDGEVDIKNQTGSLNGLTLLNIRGKNQIKLMNGNVKLTLPSEFKLDDFGLNIVTKNGKITPGNHLISSETIIKQGSGQKIMSDSKLDNELDIFVSVGSIEVN